MARWIFVALPISAWMTWTAWNGPPPPTEYQTPNPIHRPASDQAKKQVMDIASELTQRIQAAQANRPNPIPTSMLEGADESGQPFLNQPIPDNPLMPGIASVEEACPPNPKPSRQDWVHCPQTGEILAVIDGQSVRGKE